MAPGARSRRPSRPIWSGVRQCPTQSDRPRSSWPGLWPAAPAGGWARGTDPSTISGGPGRRRLGAHMTLHDADTGLRPDQAVPPEPLRPPTPGGISMRPAMIVLGLAVLILVAFVA